MNKEFWKDAFERALKTGLQVLAALWFASDGGFLNLFSVPLVENLQVALSAFVMSLITSIVSLPAGAKGTASLTSEVHYVPKDPVR